jgi:hypothetical protein
LGGNDRKKNKGKGRSRSLRDDNQKGKGKGKGNGNGGGKTKEQVLGGNDRKKNKSSGYINDGIALVGGSGAGSQGGEGGFFNSTAASRSIHLQASLNF